MFTFAAKGNPDSEAASSGWWFSYDNRSNRNRFNYTCFGNENGGWGGGGNNFRGGWGYTFEFTNGEWYHLAFTVGQSTAKLYVNGTQIGDDLALSNLVLSDTSRDLTIGSQDTSWHFNGLIDEFAIFNVELEAEDIQAIMNDGLAVLSGLAAVDLSGKLITTWANIRAR